MKGLLTAQIELIADSKESRESVKPRSRRGMRMRSETASVFCVYRRSVVHHPHICSVVVIVVFVCIPIINIWPPMPI